MSSQTGRAGQYEKARNGVLQIVAEARERAEKRLPTEYELTQRLAVGRNTLRAVVDDLVEQGQLLRVPGKGTFLASEKNEIVFANWVNSELSHSAYLDEVVERFGRRSDGARVRTKTFPYDLYGDRVLRELTGSNQIDVVQVNPFMLHSYARLGLLRPLTSFVPQHILKRQYTTAVEEVSVGTELYAVSWSVCPLVLYYNKVVLERAGLDPERPPNTVEELAEMAERVARDGGGDSAGICFPMGPHAISFMQIYPFIRSFGGSFADDTGDLRIDAGDTVRAFEWLHKLHANAGMPSERTINGSRLAFAQNRVAFLVDGPYGRGNFRELSGRGKAFDELHGATTIPIGETGRSESVLLSHALAIPTRSAQPELAYRWIEELVSNEEHARLYFDAFGMIPSFRDVLNRPEYVKDPFASVLVRQMQTAEAGPLQHPLFLEVLPYIIQTAARIVIEGDDPSRRLAMLREILRMTSIQRHLLAY